MSAWPLDTKRIPWISRTSETATKQPTKRRYSLSFASNRTSCDKAPRNFFPALLLNQHYLKTISMRITAPRRLTVSKGRGHSYRTTRQTGPRKRARWTREGNRGGRRIRTGRETTASARRRRRRRGSFCFCVCGRRSGGDFSVVFTLEYIWL